MALSSAMADGLVCGASYTNDVTVVVCLGPLGDGASGRQVGDVKGVPVDEPLLEGVEWDGL